LKNIPLVSIITPSYNQSEFIEDTLLSVKNQDYPNIEHIIVDGGSTDNTLEILRKYEGTYNMRWISEPDEGQADAIDKGFKMAKGSILAWLNSDDYYLHDKVISKVVYYFELYKNVHVVTGNGYHVNEKGKFLSPIVIKKDLINLNYMRYADFMLQPSTFFKKEVLDKVPIDKLYVYAFDWLFFLKIFEEGFNVFVVDDFLSAYRRHSKHKTGEDNAKRKKEIAEVTKRNFRVFSLQTMYCYGIYWLYSCSELLPRPIGSRLKAFIRVFNFIISKITFYRIYSC
jgi:glycosyltransferase involved in cell wall biosynthesis